MQGNKSTIVRVSGALWQPCEALSEANSNNALKDRRARRRQEGKKTAGAILNRLDNRALDGENARF